MKRSLKDARLYLVLDAQVCDYGRLWEVLRQSVQAGVDVVQLRDKAGSSRDILRFTARALTFLKGRIPFIINDRLDLVLAAHADGVHLGQDDLPLVAARKIAGDRIIIGASCQTYAQALAARRAGADYVGFGSVYKTLTKPDRKPMDVKLLERVVRRIDVPVFAIGGIKVDHCPRLRALGVRRIAVTRAILCAPHAGEATRTFLKILA